MRRIVCVLLIIVFFLSSTGLSFAGSVYIESFSKIRRSDGYIFKINYRTKDEWTDGLVFKVFCSFSKGVELSFTSSGLNNIRRGWHKTEIHIPKVYRDRYGYIDYYRAELYHKGTLIALKAM